jgi:transcriptional regulator with XRE-family HTH domain
LRLLVDQNRTHGGFAKQMQDNLIELLFSIPRPGNGGNSSFSKGGSVNEADSLHKRLKDKAYAAQFGEFIKSARENAGLSQPQLETLAGVTAKTVSNVECAVRPPTVGTLGRIATALKFGTPAECQRKFEESTFFTLRAPRSRDVPLVRPADLPADEADVFNQYAAKWQFLPDSTRRGIIVIYGGEAAYFEHFINLVATGKHTVLAYIQFGRDQNFLAFNMPQLYRALQQAVDEGRLSIEYIMLLPSRSILKDKRVIEFIGRYKAFAERLYLIYEDSPQKPDIVHDHSIILMLEARIAFVHGRDHRGSMVQPTQLMSTAMFNEKMARYREIRTASEEHFIRKGSNRVKPIEPKD